MCIHQASHFACGHSIDEVACTRITGAPCFKTVFASVDINDVCHNYNPRDKRTINSSQLHALLSSVTRGSPLGIVEFSRRASSRNNPQPSVRRAYDDLLIGVPRLHTVTSRVEPEDLWEEVRARREHREAARRAHETERARRTMDRECSAAELMARRRLRDADGGRAQVAPRDSDSIDSASAYYAELRKHRGADPKPVELCRIRGPWKTGLLAAMEMGEHERRARDDEERMEREFREEDEDALRGEGSDTEDERDLEARLRPFMDRDDYERQGPGTQAGLHSKRLDAEEAAWGARNDRKGFAEMERMRWEMLDEEELVAQEKLYIEGLDAELAKRTARAKRAEWQRRG